MIFFCTAGRCYANRKDYEQLSPEKPHAPILTGLPLYKATIAARANNSAAGLMNLYGHENEPKFLMRVEFY